MRRRTSAFGGRRASLGSHRSDVCGRGAGPSCGLDVAPRVASPKLLFRAAARGCSRATGACVQRRHADEELESMGAATLAQGARGGGITPKPLVRWTIAGLGCGAAAAAMGLALASDHADDPALQASLLDWIILSYVFSGLVAWSRRPESRFGPLMVAAGFLIAITSTPQWANAGLPYTLGWAMDLLPAPVFLHVYLAFPTGRLERRAERGVVIAAYATAAVQVVGVLLGNFGPDNVLAVVHEPGAAETLLRVQLVILSALMLAGVFLLAPRRRRAGRPPRRAGGPLVAAMALALGVIAPLLPAGGIQQAAPGAPLPR